MKLKPVQIYSAVEPKGHVPGELHRALTAYVTDDRETIDQTIEPRPLVVKIPPQFLDTDWDFQARRRWTQNGPAGGPTTS